MRRSLGLQTRVSETVASIRLRTTKSLKADASSTICDFEGLKNQMLRTFRPGNVFEDHTEISKVLFVLRISQKTTDTHSPAPKHSGRWKRHTGKEKLSEETRAHTLVDLPARGQAASPQPQVTPKPSAPFLQRGTSPLLHSYCVSLQPRSEIQAFNRIPFNLGGCSEVSNRCSQSSQFLFVLKRTISQIRLPFYVSAFLEGLLNMSFKRPPL